MRWFAFFVLSLACFTFPQNSLAEVIFPGSEGSQLISSIRAKYKPDQTLSYKAARRQMFSSIDNEQGRVRCVYTGETIATNGIPDDTVMNTEHTWPQSKFRKKRPMVSDMHHLFPTISRVNGARGNNPFADIADTETETWWHSKDGQGSIPDSSTIDQFSESTRQTFEPREDHKGNVARAMMYFLAVYGDDNIDPAWGRGQLATFLSWHASDPADAKEIARNAAIKTAQGNENPFVLDSTLASRAFGTSSPASEVAGSAGVPSAAPQKRVEAKPDTSEQPLAAHRFPDFNLDYLPPKAEYDGPLFRLSQSFPESELPPTLDTDVEAILQIPFNENTKEQNWERYLLAVRSYCFKGNTQIDWRGQDNNDHKWYHVPWQHFGEKGREGIHGLTREATAQPKQLAPTQTSKFQTHAVAVYNAQGGWTIGNVWKNQFEPDPARASFPIGTVVAKVLFTQACEKEVPYLKNPIIWKAYVQDPKDPTKRTVQDLRLLQMDIMVRDSRANSTGGWVFGTYCYNGEVGAADRWENLVPVGIQWGNDPELMDPDDNPVNKEAVETKFNEKLCETIINRSKLLPPQHLGWGGRLNGPADYYRSSCMSCHATAQYPSHEEQHPDFNKLISYSPGEPQWSAWFRNLKCGEPFSPILKYNKKRAISTDYSLQLAIGLQQFYDWKARTMGGYFVPMLPDAPFSNERAGASVPTSEPKSLLESAQP